MTSAVDARGHRLVPIVEVAESRFDTWGGRLRVLVRPGVNTIVLARQNGWGLKPFKLLLPGQVYLNRLPDYFEAETEELWALEVIGKSKIAVRER